MRSFSKWKDADSILVCVVLESFLLLGFRSKSRKFCCTENRLSWVLSPAPWASCHLITCFLPS